MNKLTCNNCLDLKCDECIDVNCWCRKTHGKHELEKSFTEKFADVMPRSVDELKQILKKPNNVSLITKGKKTFQQIILDRPITALRPITLLDDNTRMILVYLPTKTKEIKEEEDTLPEFSNKAYFVIAKDNEKKYLALNAKELQENYQIRIFDTWYQSRWNVQDFYDWMTEENKADPKDLYELLLATTKKYLDFENEYDYSYFVLWNIGTYFYELFDAYPYNDYTGTKRAGKSKSMEFQKLICYNAIMSADSSGSAMFRTIEGTGATILLDETEQFKQKNNDNAQHIRTLIMQGFLKDQYAVRSEGKVDSGFSPTTYNLFSPKSLAHINTFDDVLEDRCIQQLMRRSKSAEKLNSWPDERRDQTFKQIRNLCYRLFLDYGHEIYDLQHEASKLLDVSGRELKLWTPIITLAKFFENYGVKFLVQQIQEKSKQSTEDRQIQDEEESYDLRILRFLDDKGLDIPEDKCKGNPAGWIPLQSLYDVLSECSTDYSINMEYFGRSKLSQTLRRLGFKTERKQGGVSYLVTVNEILDVKERMGLVKPNQTTLDSSESSDPQKESMPNSESNEENEVNEVDKTTLSSRHESELNEVNELLENNKSSETSESSG